MKKNLLLTFLNLSSTTFSQAFFSDGFKGSTLPATGWTLGSNNWAVFNNAFGIARWTVNIRFTNTTLNAAYINREFISPVSSSATPIVDFLATPAILVPLSRKVRFFIRTFFVSRKNN